MAAYIEVHVKGGGRGFVEASGIAAVLCGRGRGAMDPGTAETPVRLVLRVGETLDVIGESAGMILAKCHLAKEEARRRRDSPELGAEFYIHYLDKPDG